MSNSEVKKAEWEAAKEAYAGDNCRANFKAARAAEEAYWAAIEEEEDAEDMVEAAPFTAGCIIPALRAAAIRAESIGQRAASEKQISYLASLMAKAGHDAGEFEMNSSLVLTSMNASKRIEAYLNR